MDTNNFTNFPEKLLKATEVAEILNISRTMAYKLMRQGNIRSVKIGSAVRVQPADLESFIEENVTSND